MKICSLLLALCIVLNLSAVRVFALDGIEDGAEIIDSPLVDIKVQEMCEDIVEEYNTRYGMDLILDTVKLINDFDGNVYYAIECTSTGYLIVHASTGEVVEFSAQSPSPYYNSQGELYYCGPTFYYLLKDGEYRHIWYDETLTEESLIKATAASAVLDLEIAKSEPQVQIMSEAGLYDDTNPYVQILDGLDDNDEMGYREYNGEGMCGYIAAGLMLMAYRNVKNTPELIDGFAFLKDSGTKFIDSDFTTELYRFGEDNSTSASGILGESIKDVITDYCESVNIDISCTIMTLPSESAVISRLSEGKLVQLFGMLKKTEDAASRAHSVLAYAYTESGDIIVHYGHRNYSNVVLRYVGALGEYLVINNYDVNPMTFSDFTTSYWGYNAVSYCTRYGIIDETSGSRFGIDEPMTRAMFINALFHLVGRPPVKEELVDNLVEQFTDIDRYDEYIGALAWAYDQGIINGMTTTTLAPDLTITREQAVTFLYRYNELNDYYFADVTGPTRYGFPDHEDIGDYAKDAVNWATRRYIITGNAAGNIVPLKTMTKAECAQMLYNFTNVAEYV